MVKNISKSNSRNQKQIAKKGLLTDLLTRDNLILMAILLFVTIIYSKGFKSDILNFDDNEYFNNPDIIATDWQAIKRIFSSHYLYMYQPLPVLSFSLNVKMSGVSVNALHITNLILHLICTVIVYRFFLIFTKWPNLALVVALIFAVHPLSIEAVQWISARSSAMFTSLYLLSLISYIRLLQSGQKKWLLFAFIFFVLSLFCKVQAVTLPVVLLALDYFYKQPARWNLILQKLPFFALSIVFGLVALSPKSEPMSMIQSYSVIDRLFISAHAMVFYFNKAFLPLELCSIYSYPVKESGSLPLSYYLYTVELIVLLFLVFRFRSNKGLVLGSVIFISNLVLTIYAPGRPFEVADRYFYLPQIGLYLIIAYVIINYRDHHADLFQKQWQRVMIVVAGLTIFFLVLDVKRIKVWSNDETLMTDIIQKNPPVGYVYRAYGNRGMYNKVRNKVDAALQDFNEVIKLKPNDPDGFFNRGLTYEMIRDYPSALADYNTCIALKPRESTFYACRGLLKFNLHDYKAADADCNIGLSFDSTNAMLYNCKAKVALFQEDYASTEKFLNTGIKFQPKDAQLYKMRGALYIFQKRRAEGCADLENSAQLGDEEAANLVSQNCGGLINRR